MQGHHIRVLGYYFGMNPSSSPSYFIFLFLDYKSKHVCDNLHCLVCVLADLSTLSWATGLLLLLRLVDVVFLYLFPLSSLPDSIACGSWLCDSLIDWARGCHDDVDEYFCLRVCWWWLFCWAHAIASDDVGYFTELLTLLIFGNAIRKWSASARISVSISPGRFSKVSYLYFYHWEKGCIWLTKSIATIPLGYKECFSMWAMYREDCVGVFPPGGHTNE